MHLTGLCMHVLHAFPHDVTGLCMHLTGLWMHVLHAFPHDVTGLWMHVLHAFPHDVTGRCMQLLHGLCCFDFVSDIPLSPATLDKSLIETTDIK